MGFSYTQNQEQPLNPTTASTLAAYRDELEAAGFRYEHVEQLVTEAARELVDNGLTVKAAELDFGENKTGEPEGVLPKGILDVFQRMNDEQKERADGIASKAYGHQMLTVNRTISDAVQAVGDLVAQLPGTPKLISVADSFARLAHNMEQEAVMHPKEVAAVWTRCAEAIRDVLKDF